MENEEERKRQLTEALKVDAFACIILIERSQEMNFYRMRVTRCRIVFFTAIDICTGRSWEEMTKCNKTRATKRSRTLIALYYWTKLTGVNPLSLTKSNELEFSYFSLFYVLFLVACYTCVFYRSLIERSKYLVPGETPISVIVDYMGLINMYLEVLCTWLGFCFSRKRLTLLIKCFAKAERTSRKLDIPDNGDKYLRKLAIYMVVANTLFATATSFNVVATTCFSDFSEVPWILYNVPRLAPTSTMTLFIWSLLVVKEKFRLLNEKVDSLFMQSDYTELQVVANDVFRDSINSVSMWNSSCKSSPPLEKIDIFARSHRQLRDVIHRIEEHFAVFAMANVASQIPYLTTITYVIWRYVKIHNLMSPSDLFYVTLYFTGVLLSVASLVIESNVCGSTSDEANKTGNNLHAMLNNRESFCDDRKAAKLHALSLDLLQNKTRISLYGCFDLDSYFVYRTIATATSYMIIMLQFYS